MIERHLPEPLRAGNFPTSVRLLGIAGGMSAGTVVCSLFAGYPPRIHAGRSFRLQGHRIDEPGAALDGTEKGNPQMGFPGGMILLHAGIAAFSQSGLPVYNGKPHKIPIRASHSRFPAEALRCGHNDQPVPCNNDGVLLLRRKAAVRHTQRPPVRLLHYVSPVDKKGSIVITIPSFNTRLSCLS